MQSDLFSAPQVCAFIATVIGLAFGLGLLISRSERERATLFLPCLMGWALYLYGVWGAAGLWSGRSFWSAGFDPFLLFLRSIPVLLKAL